MKKTIIKVTMCGIVLMLMLSSQMLFADDTIVVKSAYEISIYKDGSTKVVPIEVRGGDNPAKRSFDSATLIRPTRWTPGVKLVKFNFTDFASDFKTKIRKASAKYHNTKRGNTNVPRIKTTSTIDRVIEMSTYANVVDFYGQFAYDDKNTIVMTKDDQFFKSPSGIWFNPNSVATTRVYSSATFQLKKGKWVGVYYIEDTDIELRSDFFDLPSNQQNIILAAAFKFAMGYQKSVWTHDILSENPTYVDIDELKDKDSDVWQKLVHQWDNFFYKDRLLGPAAAFHSAPKVMPFDGEVIDIADYKTPLTDDNKVLPLKSARLSFLQI